jgi:PAS domain-containing protein
MVPNFGTSTMELRGKPIKMAGSIIDITETVNHRSALLKNEFLLNESAKLARIGAWEVDLITQKVYWSESTKAIYEYPSYLETPSLQEALLYYPEASRDIFSKAFNESIALGKSFDISCEFLTYAQNKIWVRVIGSPLFDIQGTIIGVRGVIKNIDEEKQKELFYKIL